MCALALPHVLAIGNDNGKDDARETFVMDLFFLRKIV